MRRTFDYSPFARSTVGFDRMLRLLDSAPTGEAPSYPPYNIARTGEDQYEVAVAVAGFGEDELEVKLHEGQLTIKSTPEKAEQQKEGVTYLHRGIARRAFELRFSLADYIEVSGAYMENGMLHVELVRNVPEAMKPRTIEIGKAGTGKALPGKKAA